jgi:hypothetical protein
VDELPVGALVDVGRIVEVDEHPPRTRHERKLVDVAAFGEISPDAIRR